MAFSFSRSKAEDLARAQDPSTVPADLVALAMHKDDGVRAAVAGRADCPMATMLVLAQDKDGDVLDALVQNPSASVTVLQMLADSRRGGVRNAARRRLGVTS
ncbi:hypothetical protein RN607_11725 [Demequina capsici]|uniref:Leucine rich repeat variant n=1 Tax=Demequina capsici TaxID=3075620 RepID=A0AA96F653_9MICO|nr:MULTISPECIES: hypothetical protein [unclassified Demequina]WNM24034.1 hypothetical protein RN606_11790 [Demequina sp. OYTSA14]WNM26861.1 hypothetical protein RN607_11725 [Demequina sp. PMTSA13]